MGIHKNRILFEDDHLLAAEKLSNELVVKGAGKNEKLALLDFLRKDHPSLLGVHRLDFETSGIVIFAKNSDVLSAIKESKFKGWRKNYHTLVMGRLSKNFGVITKKLPARRGGALVASKTEYKVLNKFANSTYVDALIESGRHHQIRRHFAAIRHPLVLDDEYGHKKFNRVFTQEFGIKRFFLHAQRIRFAHPVTGKPVDISCPLPKQFSKMIKLLDSL